MPPSIAAITLARPIDEAIEKLQAELDAVTASLAPMEAVYQHEQQQWDTHVQPVHGHETISAAIRLAVESCDGELLTAHPRGGRPAETLADALPRDLALISRGVHQRTLYSHTVRSHGPTLGYMEQVTSAGAEIRTTGETFERMIVCDRSVAFIPVLGSDGNEQRALAIRDNGLIQYLVSTFEALWERADPIEFDATHHFPPQLTDEIQRTILELMVKGHTDEAISKRLGLSARSIGTHIKRASSLFGSRSRAELGYSLAKAGVLGID
ncbi:LuxR C-terminal-related transcriptional regulator [Streptomyces sp. NPDC006463]|uniref:LuxR C-terminal-related transcriptional regulator n=1 Tax=Streptomyces sp. NPDC006463 TaxID=3364746 RepID=UPI0036AA0F15